LKLEAFICGCVLILLVATCYAITVGFVISCHINAHVGTLFVVVAHVNGCGVLCVVVTCHCQVCHHPPPLLLMILVIVVLVFSLL
jgi:hypothetical protein